MDAAAAAAATTTGADAAPPAPSSAPEPIPAKTAAPAPSSSEKPSPTGAAAKARTPQIRRVLTTTDALLLRLSRLLSTPSGTDSLLCTLSYTLTFVAAHTRAYVSARLQRFAAALAIKATGGALLPGETLIATLPASSALARASRATESMTKLAALVSDFRVFVRLWALLDVYTWARGVWRQGDDERKEGEKGKDYVQRALVWAEVAATAAFQALENAAYLADKGVLNGAWVTGEKGKRRVARWWVWSSRFWAAYVGLELVRLGWVWAKESNGDDDNGDKKVAAAEDEESRRAKALAWWKQLVSNMAWAPMTLHWSTEEGFISDAWIGFLGIVAGGVGLYEKWKLTAL
ncbi:hypothetical protein BKA81DRAFT_407854 [Phyllosticta paracitricarpa]|uniref:Peroxin 11C n=1 Tax=Phyllosticta paracitricarpa TaxID=2016321 RepID=A0ABR1NCB7_9PEZI